MAWTGVITNAGNALLNQWASEKTLHIDSAATGTGRAQVAALMAQTDLTNRKQTASILSGEQTEAGYKVKLQVAAAESAYNMSQYGVWGHLDDGGTTLLALFQNDKDIPIPSRDESPDFVYTFYALLAFSNKGTLELHIDTSATVSLGEMQEYVGEELKKKQDKIEAKGLLKGDGQGNITAAEAGTDYGLPTPKGSGAPTEETAAVVGQHYFDEDSGKEYVCTDVDEDGKTTWKQAGATDAEDLTYKGQSLGEALDGMKEAIDGAKPLSGAEDPTEKTKGTVGQTYLNTTTGQTFVCTGADEESGTYTWTESGGGVKPQITVTVDMGAEVTCTCGEKVLRGTSTDGTVTFDLPGYGAWVLKATMSDKESNSVTVVVDQVKQYTAELSFFSAALTVTAEEGAAVTATDGVHTFRGTCTGGNTCTLTIAYAGNYTVTAEKEGAKSNSATVDVKTSGESYTAAVTFIVLTVQIDAGSSVTVSLDTDSYTKEAAGGSAKFYLPKTGTWTVKATLGDQTAEDNITCDSYKGYELQLSYVKIYGVTWDGESGTKWLRTDDAARFTDPVPYVKSGDTGSSMFDDCMPWSGMKQENRAGGAMVKIPKFWYKLETSGSKGLKIQIADKQTEGFHVAPAHMDRGDGQGERDAVYVGRYHCSSDYKSKTGERPLANITRQTARDGCKGVGDGYSQLDFATRFTIWLLYIVEFADWNSQEKIGKGCGNNSSTGSMGYTDDMGYHTGTTQTGRDSYGLGTQYRWIEGLWDNVLDWIDGCYNDSKGLNIILNPEEYSDGSGGTSIGIPSNGYPSKFAVSDAAGFPMFYPTEANGSDSTYSCDSWNFSASNPCVYGGGSYYQDGGRGLFYLYYGSVSFQGGLIGSRLQELPKKG